ncbi:unnamed protein product, partial [Ectocarpus sp. 4 AP-2014]
ERTFYPFTTVLRDQYRERGVRERGRNCSLCADDNNKNARRHSAEGQLATHRIIGERERKRTLSRFYVKSQSETGVDRRPTQGDDIFQSEACICSSTSQTSLKSLRLKNTTHGRDEKIK